MNNAKISALSKFINAGMYEIGEVSEDYGKYAWMDHEFLVLTDDEALDAVVDQFILVEEVTDPKTIAEKIEEKGRGFWLAADSEENEEAGYFIYRLN